MPAKTYTLPEKDGHVVSFSQHGNPKGAAIISFHGGPGSKSETYHAENFDLKKYRVILFDQRGCGKSLPSGKLENNTTDNLLGDAERIREQLGIEKWFAAGSSWGSSLSLLYAIKHPKRTRGILISAVFLADRDSMAWAMEDEKGVARLMPDVWAKRMDFFKRFNIKLKTQNSDILKALHGATLEKQKEIAAEIQDWEGNLFSTLSPVSYKNPENITDENIASVRIYMHYEINHEFIPDNFILKNVSAIESMPAVIVHGRYDVLCPLQKAHELAGKLKNAELIVATSSGHKLTAEGETIRKMAFDRFLERHAT
ncbi:MAG: alpha/beta fold hydrolase [Candidatus Wildermuthbacteria bacterium]|nr:alpha/beta fold hydrolase [Candidatus Wildermuthbacteria bacterium]